MKIRNFKQIKDLLKLNIEKRNKSYKKRQSYKTKKGKRGKLWQKKRKKERKGHQEKIMQ